MRGSNFVWTKENAELEGQKVSGLGKQCGPVGTGKGLVEGVQLGRAPAESEFGNPPKPKDRTTGLVETEASKRKVVEDPVVEYAIADPKVRKCLLIFQILWMGNRRWLILSPADLNKFHKLECSGYGESSSIQETTEDGP